MSGIRGFIKLIIIVAGLTVGNAPAKTKNETICIKKLYDFFPKNYANSEAQNFIRYIVFNLLLRDPPNQLVYLYATNLIRHTLESNLPPVRDFCAQNPECLKNLAHFTGRDPDSISETLFYALELKTIKDLNGKYSSAYLIRLSEIISVDESAPTPESHCNKVYGKDKDAVDREELRISYKRSLQYVRGKWIMVDQNEYGN